MIGKNAAMGKPTSGKTSFSFPIQDFHDLADQPGPTAEMAESRRWLSDSSHLDARQRLVIGSLIWADQVRVLRILVLQATQRDWPQKDFETADRRGRRSMVGVLGLIVVVDRLAIGPINPVSEAVEEPAPSQPRSSQVPDIGP